MQRKIEKDICKLLECIRNTKTNDEVAIQAIKAYVEVSEIKNINISNCTIKN